MPFSTTTFFLFLLLLPLSSPTSLRRILHQPIFSGDDSPPPSSSPPSPPTPDIPFSTSTPPNPDSAFFPNTSPSPPPPPPSASSLASFPANISSLNLPHTPKSNSASTKLIAAAVSAVLVAVIFLLIAVYLHRRKRRNQSTHSETKTSRSETNSSLNNQALNNIPKLTRPSQTSSEFLYLGTLVNSHVNLDPHQNQNLNQNQNQNARSNTTHISGLNPRKMDSPELHPLPPLLNRQQQMNSGAQDVEVENEEFYSPRGSGSIGVGSASRRDFASIRVSSSSSSSSYSCSSSVSGSPARSASSSISPSVSVSPKRSVSRPKSPDLEAVELHAPPLLVAPVAPLLVSTASSPVSSLSVEGLPSGLDVSSPRISSASSDDYIEIEPPPTMSESVQKNVLIFNPFRFSSVLDDNGGSPERNEEHVVQNENDLDLGSAYLSDQNEDINELISSPLDDNKEDVPESDPQDVDSLDTVTSLAVKENEYSDVSDESLESPKSVTNPVKDSGDSSESSDEDVQSPERVTNPVMQAGDVSDVSDERVTNPVMQAGDVSDVSDVSDERVTNPVIQAGDVSERYSTSSDVPDHSVESPVKQEIPVLVPSVQLSQPISVPPPPPPLPIKYWDSPRTPTPPAKKPISAPPALVTPLKPMMIESPILISPVQLPTGSDDHESNEASAGRSDNLDEANERSDETPKPKLKQLHWDKVRASSDREMVWDQLRSSSFKLNEEMIESLFIVKAPNPTHAETTRRQILPLPNQENRVLDPKKSQNIAILLKALHVTVDEVCESLLEGNAEPLGTDLLESLLKMAPTKEEEYKLKEHKDDSPIKLGPAERFLKEVLDVPFAFKRVDAMLYISNFDSEVEYLKKSFETLETACEELRNSRMFLKLLEAVLKTGNRMNVGTNRGDAHAFKLDTLLKLIDVKGTDGKTTLLHFVVQEITRSEGARISASNENQISTTNDDVKCRKLGLHVVSSIASDLSSVKKAAAMDSEILHSYVMKLSKGIEKILEVIKLNETIGSDESSSNKFSETMNGFLKTAEEDIIRIQAQESVALTVVKEITEYFHGNSTKEEAHPFRIFMVVRDFLSVLEKVCKEVGMINERTIVSSAHKFPVPVNPMLQPISSGFPGRRQYSSSDDESPTT